jgi:hypothetical protein
MSSDLIMLDRIGNTQWGAFGRMHLPDGWVCMTVEPPWRHNAHGESCIPAGDYVMEMRQSPIVARITHNDFTRGWEIIGVPKRDLIMIHPGNFAGDDGDTDGCVLVGRAYGVMDCKPGITASRATFKDLMERLNQLTKWRIVIRWITPE